MKYRRQSFHASSREASLHASIDSLSPIHASGEGRGHPTLDPIGIVRTWNECRSPPSVETRPTGIVSKTSSGTNCHKSLFCGHALTTPPLCVRTSVRILPKLRVKLRKHKQCTVASMLRQTPLGIGDRGLGNCPDHSRNRIYLNPSLGNVAVPSTVLR
jgi:hypothetical protein